MRMCECFAATGHLVMGLKMVATGHELPHWRRTESTYVTHRTMRVYVCAFCEKPFLIMIRFNLSMLMHFNIPLCLPLPLFVYYATMKISFCSFFRSLFNFFSFDFWVVRFIRFVRLYPFHLSTLLCLWPMQHTSDALINGYILYTRFSIRFFGPCFSALYRLANVFPLCERVYDSGKRAIVFRSR